MNYLSLIFKTFILLFLSIPSFSLATDKITPSLNSTITQKAITGSASKLREFEHAGLKFTLVQDEKDINVLAEVYAEGAATLFGQTINSQTALSLAKDDIQKNHTFINGGEFPDILTWTIEKDGDVVGVINAEVLGYKGADFSKKFENVGGIYDKIKEKGYFNMSRVVTSKAQGQGIGTAACQALVKNIFEFTNAEGIISYSLASNTASQISAEKCGFKFQFNFNSDEKKLYSIEKEGN